MAVIPNNVTIDMRYVAIGTKADDEDDNNMEEKIKECEDLQEEAQIPLTDLIAKYKKQSKEHFAIY